MVMCLLLRMSLQLFPVTLQFCGSRLSCRCDSILWTRVLPSSICCLRMFQCLKWPVTWASCLLPSFTSARLSSVCVPAKQSTTCRASFGQWQLQPHSPISQKSSELSFPKNFISCTETPLSLAPRDRAPSLHPTGSSLCFSYYIV